MQCLPPKPSSPHVHFNQRGIFFPFVFIFNSPEEVSLASNLQNKDHHYDIIIIMWTLVWVPRTTDLQYMMVYKMINTMKNKIQ